MFNIKAIKCDFRQSNGLVFWETESMYQEIHKDLVMKKYTNSVQMTLRYAELSNHEIKHLNNVISCIKREKLYWIVLFAKRKRSHLKAQKMALLDIFSVYFQCMIQNLSTMLLENHTCISELSWASLTNQEYYLYCYSFNIAIFLI